MNILLTGHKGFIGSRIYKVLEADHNVTGFSCGVDLGTWGDTFRSLNPKDIDLVIHCGAVSDSYASGNHLWEMNYEATKGLLDWANQAKAKFIFISSAAAHKPTNQYGWTKRCIEDFTMLALPRFIFCILRLHNVWALDEPEKASPSIIRKLISGELKCVYKGCKRWFVHVDDVVDAIVSLTHIWQPSNYDIRGDENTSIEALVDAVYEGIDIPKPKLIDCPADVPTEIETYFPTNWNTTIRMSNQIDPIRKTLMKNQ